MVDAYCNFSYTELSMKLNVLYLNYHNICVPFADHNVNLAPGENPYSGIIPVIGLIMYTQLLMTYCQLDHEEKDFCEISVNIAKYNQIFFQEHVFENAVCKMWAVFFRPVYVDM